MRHCTRAVKAASEIMNSYSPDLDVHMKTCSKDSAAEWNKSHYRIRRLSSLSQKTKLKKKFRKHLNTPMI